MDMCVATGHDELHRWQANILTLAQGVQAEFHVRVLSSRCEWM